MSNQLHVPMRMCVVTREKLPKKELLRFVCNSENKELVLDKGERVRGRGVNIKPDVEIFDMAVKRRVFEREFGIKLDAEFISKLRLEVEEYIDTKFREKKVVRISQENLDKISEK